MRRQLLCASSLSAVCLSPGPRLLCSPNHDPCMQQGVPTAVTKLKRRRGQWFPKNFEEETSPAWYIVKTTVVSFIIITPGLLATRTMDPNSSFWFYLGVIKPVHWPDQWQKDRYSFTFPTVSFHPYMLFFFLLKTNQTLTNKTLICRTPS